MGDTGNALLAAIAIVAALFHRDKTGEGQSVSTSIVNAGLLHTSYAWIHADGTPAECGHVDKEQFGLSPFYRLYKCAEQVWIFIAAASHEHRDRLMNAVGAPEAPRNDEASLHQLLSGWCEDRSAKTCFDLLDKAGVPVEIVDESFCRTIFDDPEARAAKLVSQTQSGSVGRFEDSGLLVNIAPSECVIQRGPCMCGEHTREILSEYGYSDADIDSLAADKAILDNGAEET
jgi:crotonobetainyl-CoA:carnitine CoA-transferase CaiB-like acyl-CoA transferase